jgi:hypothetical protein
MTFPAIDTSLATRKMVYRILDHYKSSPKFVGFIQALGKRFDDTDTIIEHLLFGRFLDTAEDFELDRIGKLLGFDRPHKEIPELIFTTKASTNPLNNTSQGFGSSTLPGVGGLLSSSWGLTSDELVDDDTYRPLLQTRARVINLGPSIPEFYTWITESFGIDITITVPAVMQIEIEITSGSLNTYERNLIENYGPTLPGVSVFITNWSA